MTYPPHLFRRIAPETNTARFYGLSIEPTLFGEVALVRVWGRIGTRGRMRLDIQDDEKAAVEALLREAAKRLRRGYASAE